MYEGSSLWSHFTPNKVASRLAQYQTHPPPVTRILRLLRMSPICWRARELCSMLVRVSTVPWPVLSPPAASPSPPIMDSRSISRSPMSSILTRQSAGCQLSPVPTAAAHLNFHHCLSERVRSAGMRRHKQYTIPRYLHDFGHFLSVEFSL